MKKVIACDEFELLLAEWFDGRGGLECSSLLEAHAATCPRCARMLEAERSLEDWLKARLSPPGLEEDFTRRLLDRLEPLEPVAVVPRWVEWFEVGGGVSLAAAAAWILSLVPVAALGRWLTSAVPQHAAWALAAVLVGLGFWLISETYSVQVDS